MCRPLQAAVKHERTRRLQRQAEHFDSVHGCARATSHIKALFGFAEIYPRRLYSFLIESRRRFSPPIASLCKNTPVFFKDALT